MIHIPKMLVKKKQFMFALICGSIHVIFMIQSLWKIVVTIFSMNWKNPQVVFTDTVVNKI